MVLKYLNQSYFDWIEVETEKIINTETQVQLPYSSTVLFQLNGNIMENVYKKILPKCYEVKKQDYYGFLNNTKESKPKKVNTILNYLPKTPEVLPQPQQLSNTEFKNSFYKPNSNDENHKLLEELILLVNFEQLLVNMNIIPEIDISLYMNQLSQYIEISKSQLGTLFKISIDSGNKNVNSLFNTMKQMVLCNSVLDGIKNLCYNQQTSNPLKLEIEHLLRYISEISSTTIPSTKISIQYITSYVFELYFNSFLPQKFISIIKAISNHLFDYEAHINYYYEILFNYKRRTLFGETTQKHSLNYQCDLIPLLYLNTENSEWKFREVVIDNRVYLDLNYITWTGKSLKVLANTIKGVSNIEGVLGELLPNKSSQYFLKPKTILNLIDKESIGFKIESLFNNSELVKEEIGPEINNKNNKTSEEAIEKFLESRMKLKFHYVDEFDKNTYFEKHKLEVDYSQFINQNKMLPVFYIDQKNKNNKSINVNILLEIFRLDFEIIFKESIKII
jgi:hypothetical protein